MKLDNTYNRFQAYNNGFHDNVVNSLKELITKEIKNRSFFAKAYIVITSAGNTYKIGYNSIMDSNTYAGNNMDFDIFTSSYNNGIKAAEDYQENPYKYYKDSNLTLLNPNYFNTNELNYDFKNNIIQWTFDTIKNITKGISVDEKGKNNLILDLSQYGGNVRTIVENIQIVFRKTDFIKAGINAKNPNTPKPQICSSAIVLTL